MMGLLKGERVLLITPWLSSQKIRLWMGIWESPSVWYGCQCISAVMIGTSYSLTLINPITEGSSKSLGKTGNSLFPSVSRTAIPAAYQYPFVSLKYPLLRQTMPKIHGASELVTMVCLFHTFLVTLTSASNTLSYREPPTPQKYKCVWAPYTLVLLHYNVCQYLLETQTPSGHWIHADQ